MSPDGPSARAVLADGASLLAAWAAAWRDHGQSVRGAADVAGPAVAHARPTRSGTPAAETGDRQSEDLLRRFLRACVQAGGAPAGIAVSWDAVSTDHVAAVVAAVAFLIRGSDPVARVLHVADGHRPHIDDALVALRAVGHRGAASPVDHAPAPVLVDPAALRAAIAYLASTGYLPEPPVLSGQAVGDL